LCAVCVMLFASGTPNPTGTVIDQSLCISFSEAEAVGIDITELREEYPAAVSAFPNRRDDVAAAWSQLQFTLRDQLSQYEKADFAGCSMFTVVLFKGDGTIARFFYQGLDEEHGSALCDVVERLARTYRFPLQSEDCFSQCGTTHFKENSE
jgi:hypothetical protein